MTNQSGIYTLTHVDSGRIYVGASRNLDARRYSHYRELHLNKHHCRELQVDFNGSACGNSAVEFTVINVCPVEALHEMEKLHIEALSPSYNQNAAGGGLRKEATEETRQKMRERMTGHQIRYIGTFKTPFGDFTSSKKGSDASEGGMSQASVWKACRNSDTLITRRSYVKTRYLKENFDESIIDNKTWHDLGFGFVAKADA